MMTRLDDLRSAFAVIDRRVAMQHAMALAQLRDHRLMRVRRSLRPLVAGQLVLIAFGFAMLVLGASTWSASRADGGLLVAGIIMHAYGVMTMIAGGSTLALVARIDHAAPVLTIQRRLLSVRRWYVGWGMAVGLPWWLLWIPFLMCIGRGGLGTAPPTWFLLNIAVGGLGLLATWAFLRWLRRPGREALRQRLDDGAAGRSIVRAQSELDELARFEQS